MSFLTMSTDWVDGFLWQLLAFALRATVILAGAWAATLLLRRASAATRHLIWTAGIAGVLALPVLTFAIPAWDVPMFTVPARVDAPAVTEAARVTVGQPATTVAATSPSAIAPRGDTPAPAPQSAVTSGFLERIQRLSVRGVVLGLWLTLALLLLARLAVATTRLSSWKGSSRPVEDSSWLALVRRLTRSYGIERPVVLLENSLTDVPVTWGIVYPVILLPASSEEWDEEQRVAVLTHELAHVKRFDALSQLLGQLALALLWFHPLVWMAVRRMRMEREHACDDFVLVAGARASRYADDLLGLARRLSRPTAPAAAALAMARRSELEGRLLAILDPAMKRTAVRRARVALLTLAVMVLSAPLAAFRPAARVTLQQPDVSSTAALAAPTPTSGQQSGVRASAPSVMDLSRSSVTFPSALPRVSSQAQPVTPATLEPVAPGPSLPVASEQALQRLREQLNDIPESAPGSKSQQSQPAKRDTIDMQTLIDVTLGLKKMSSDYDKSQMLAEIAKRYRPNDALRDAYLDIVFSMSSDYERGNALVALLSRDSLPLASTARVLQSAKLMSSDVSRAVVLKRISVASFADTLVQKAYLEVIVAMSSDTERANAIRPFVKQRPLTPAVQLGLLRGIHLMSSDFEKANMLLLFLENQGIGDQTVRGAFMRAAEKLSSDYDYRRVMAAVLR
jgi:beta-lactamase regulating signal transducer with metallopeptidase domain